MQTVKREFAEGTLKPSKFLRGKDKGMVLEWKIDELAAGENRLIGYNIKSRLSIIGSFKLPRAKIIFVKKGKEQTAYSNSVSVGIWILKFAEFTKPFYMKLVLLKIW